MACAIFEDPYPPGGVRQIWLEPVEVLPPGLAWAELRVDLLPTRTEINIRLPESLGGQLRATWRDRYGYHYREPVHRRPPGWPHTEPGTDGAPDGGHGGGHGQQNDNGYGAAHDSG